MGQQFPWATLLLWELGYAIARSNFLESSRQADVGETDNKMRVHGVQSDEASICAVHSRVTRETSHTPTTVKLGA